MPKSVSGSKSYLISNKEIKNNILPHFNINATEIMQIKFKDTDKQRCVYKISTENNVNYCLKKVYYSVDDFLFIYCAIEWLFRKGILVPKILPSNDGNRFYICNKMLFILTPWINGEKCNYDLEKHILLSIKNLSKMHKISRDFYPLPHVKLKKLDDQLYPSIKKHFNNLLNLNNYAFKINDTFSTLFLNKFPINETLCKISSEAALSIDYSLLSKSIVHNDYVNKNLIINEQNELYVIDFDKCKFGYSVQDLCYSLRRLLKRNSVKWNFGTFNKIINTYEETNSLSLHEFLYLLSYLSFPQKYWRISKDYYNNLSKYNKKMYISLLSKDLNKCEAQLIFSITLKEYIENRFTHKKNITPS